MEWLVTKMVSTFTSTPYSGNPAWIVLGLQAHVQDALLVKLASNLNPVSDTVFVFPGDSGTDISLRFFSKSEEISFSGHGTIAAYCAIENEDIITFTEPITLVRQKTKTGTQHLELRIRDGRIERVTVSLPVPRFISIPIDIKLIARVLGLPPVDVHDSTYPVGVVEVSGNTDIVVPVASCETLLNIHPDFDLMKKYCDRQQITGVVVWCMKTIEQGHTAHMRHFAPSVGISEDPVSGAASAALGSFFVHHKIAPMDEVIRVVIEQGYSMGKPGTVYVHVHTHNNDILKVTFGGQGVVTFEGRILTPDNFSE